MEMLLYLHDQIAVKPILKRLIVASSEQLARSAMSHLFDDRKAATSFYCAPYQWPAPAQDGSSIYTRAQAVADRTYNILLSRLGIEGARELDPALSAFRFSLQFMVTMDALPLMLRVLSEAAGFDEIVLFESLIPKSAWPDEVNNSSTQFRFTARDKGEELAQLLNQALTRAPLQQPSKRGDPLLVILGSEVDVGLGAQYLNKELKERGEQNRACQVLLKRAKPSLVTSLQEACPDLSIDGVYRLDQLPLREKSPLSELVSHYRALEGSAKHEVSPIVTSLMQSLITALSLIGFVEQIRPSMVFGTFEKSPLGVTLSAIKHRLGFRLVSYQHGIMNRTLTMGLFDFDTFFVWNALFADLVTADGYVNDASLEVLDLRTDNSLNPRFQPLLRPHRPWLSSGPCLLFCEQPITKSPYSISDYEAILQVISTLSTDLRLTTLIKPHPKTYSDAAMALLCQRLPNLTRLERSVTLDEALQVCDFSVSMTSTALLDCMAVGKPAISYDPGGWAQLTGFPDALFTYNTRSVSELTTAVRACARLGRTATRLHNALRRRSVLP